MQWGIQPEFGISPIAFHYNGCKIQLFEWGWELEGTGTLKCTLQDALQGGCFARSESSKNIFNGLDLLKVSYKYDTYLTYRILFDISTIDYRVKRLKLCTTGPPGLEWKAF